jgi:hypothetical protein
LTVYRLRINDGVTVFMASLIASLMIQDSLT